jgi:hypothetical protein
MLDAPDAKIDHTMAERRCYIYSKLDRGPVATPAGYFCRYLRTVR